MRHPNHNRLAIVVPTFRFDERARQALKAAASAGTADIAIHIGDNSENPEKHAFLDDLAARSTNVVVHCHARNIGAYANWLFLLKAHDAAYVCLAADDDIYLPPYFQAGLDLMSEDPRCAAASGLFISTAHRPGLDRLVLDSQPERIEADPLDRLKAYHGQNAMAYAVARRDVLDGFADYVALNPLNGPFNDFLLSFHLLSMGTYRVRQNAPAYIYDNSAWQFAEAEKKSSGKFYVACGLPESFYNLFKLHWAVSNVHFFESRFRSGALSDEQASAIAAYLYDRLRAEAKWDCSQKPAEIDELFEGKQKARDAFATLLNEPYSRALPVFGLFALIVGAFSQQLRKDLIDFQTATLLPEAQRPRPQRPEAQSSGGQLRP